MSSVSADDISLHIFLYPVWISQIEVNIVIGKQWCPSGNEAGIAESKMWALGKREVFGFISIYVLVFFFF